MKTLERILTQKFIFPVIIALIGGIIAFANWEPNTFLSGWDTLHPEFNFPLAFERAINGVWRADQGLGAVAIQSHMAELPRIFLLWILSFAFPVESLRYITMLSPLVIGPLGLYFLSLFFLKGKKYKYMASFLASLSYVMSLGAVQHYVVPLEMFVVHFAFLPWVLLTLFKFMQKGSKKLLLAFIMLSVFLIPQAHTATLLYVYILGIFTTLFAYFLLNRSKEVFMKALFLALLTIIINSYIILPNLFAAENHGEEVRNSRINRFFSQEAFAKNQQFGNVQNAAITRSFLFDWQLYDFDNNQSVDVVASWKENLKNPLVLTFGYLIFLVSGVGIVRSVLKRDKAVLPLVPITLIAFLMLLNGTFPMTVLFDNLARISETLKESLRFPFTKFSILYMLGLSIFFGFGIQYILSKINKKRLNFITTALITLGFILYFLPAFKGTLINPAMRISIPNEYFSMFEFFDKQDKDERVAVLPIHSFWGWVYNDWGYQGAGFLQFGIKQPLLDRDHDRWSRLNEQYQREMQYAIYSQNVNLINDVLNKYDVKWILFDTSVTNLSGYQHETLAWQIPDMLNRFDNITLTQKFGEDVYVYEVKNENSRKAAVFENMPDAGPSMIGSHSDRIYSELKDYKTRNKLSSDPEADNYIFDEHFVGQIEGQPVITINSNSPLSESVACSNAEVKRNIENGAIRYESTNGSLCDYFAFPDLSHDKAHIVTFETRNIEGFPLQVYICNDLSLHCNQTIYLKKGDGALIEAFVIPAYYDNGTGQTININNYSINNKRSINELVSIKIYEYLPQAFTSSQERAKFTASSETIEQTTGYVSIKLNEVKNNSTLTLSERFHSGWKAYVMPETDSNIASAFNKTFPFVNGKEIIDHNIVNNWKNGWEIDESYSGKQITFVFMPQYLQYLGLILLGLPLSLALAFAIQLFPASKIAQNLRSLNSFFEVNGELLRLKVIEERDRNILASFPYSIDLSDKAKIWKN